MMCDSSPKKERKKKVDYPKLLMDGPPRKLATPDEERKKESRPIPTSRESVSVSFSEIRNIFQLSYKV